jgi:hypothetical protein
MKEFIFFPLRNSPDECSVAKGGKMVSSPDTVGMSYGNYMEEKHIPPPNMTTNERRVIVPAGQMVTNSLWLAKHGGPEGGRGCPKLCFSLRGALVMPLVSRAVVVNRSHQESVLVGEVFTGCP